MIMIEHKQPAQVWTFTPPLHLQAWEPTRYATGSMGAAIRELDRLNMGRWYSDRYQLGSVNWHPEIAPLISELS